MYIYIYINIYCINKYILSIKRHLKNGNQNYIYIVKVSLGVLLYFYICINIINIYTHI